MVRGWFVIAAASLLVTYSEAHARRKLAPGDWFERGGVICGKVNKSFVPGRFSGENFITHLESAKRNSALARKAKGKRKRALQQAAKKDRNSHQSQAPICQGNPGGSTPSPSPSQTRDWTVMVYLAADNSLAISGIKDIDEMENGGGSNDKVAVVAQAEFNPEYLAKYDISSPQDFNRPNWNTFRYVVTSSSSTRTGPDGQAIDIGNRAMTSPEELAEFVSWAKQNYPAKHYLLLLWNHGGGFSGLIEDLTNTDKKLMSLQELRRGLEMAGKVDVIDFDMCLMGQYESLNAVRGLADYVVASEEVEPGDGNPYDLIIRALNSNPSMTPEQVSMMIVDRYHESYAGSRSSTTKSAVSLAQLGAFDQVLNDAARYLSDNISSLRSQIQTAAANAQSYTVSFFKDLKHAFDLLKAQSPQGSASLQPAIDMLAGTNFVIRNARRDGNDSQSKTVANSNGLAISLPSLQGDDLFQSTGSYSFENYQIQMPNHAWTEFLGQYMSGSAPSNSINLSSRPEWYLAWAQQAISNSAEVDVYRQEPSGRYYTPLNGTVTPNGVLTPDSQETGYPYEGYAFRQTIQTGTYYLVGLLRADPYDYQPYVNVFYRASENQDFTAVYSNSNLPWLSLQNSFRNDPNMTVQKVLDGNYTDLRLLDSWCFGDGCAQTVGNAGGSGVGMTQEQLKK